MYIRYKIQLIEAEINKCVDKDERMLLRKEKLMLMEKESKLRDEKLKLTEKRAKYLSNDDEQTLILMGKFAAACRLPLGSQGGIMITHCNRDASEPDVFGEVNCIDLYKLPETV